MLLPFDLILTVASACAVFLLGFFVWGRNRHAVGNLVFALLAFSLALWTSADWFLRLRSGVPEAQVFFWKTLFYFSVCLGPALSAHASFLISRRPFRRYGTLVYALAAISFLILFLGFYFKQTAFRPDLVLPFLKLGSAIGLLLYGIVTMMIGAALYPQLLSSAATVLTRRRAAYGVVILVPFLVSGALQLVSGPVPTGFLMPILCTAFIFLSLLAFLRASFLEVRIGSLEAFFLPLLTFGVVMLLRSTNLNELLVTLIAIVAVCFFGFFAIHELGKERAQRELAEQATDRLARLDMARKDFVNMVAHQLRGPLGGIRGSASMLVDGDFGELPPKAHESVRRIKDASDRLLSLAETFLAAARMDVGAYESRLSIVDVREKIRALLDEMEFSAEAKHLEIVATFADHLPERLSLDEEVLQNVVFNLLDNAVKYTQQGTVEIETEYASGELVFRIRDTGQGMTAEEMHGLFQKFRRSGGRAHDQDGTGLGLYIVRELLLAVKGTVRVDSEGPGKGSTFTVTLPAEKIDDQA